MKYQMEADNPFNYNDIEMIHGASMLILEKNGIVIDSPKVIDLFKKNGFKVEGSRIFFTEQQVFKALKTTPRRFEIRARNPEKNLQLGSGTPVLCGTGGELFIAEKDGTQRQGTMEDYLKIAKLVHTSPLTNQITAHESVHPHDIPTEISHLEMLLCDMTLCDLAVTPSTQDLTTIQDSLDMLGIVFGGKEELQKQPVSLGIINPLSPLQYAPEQAEGLMLLAENGQAVALTNMLLLGSTAPVSIPGALAMGNAEQLAGVVLSQLAKPGTPVVYGSTSCPMYMRNGASYLGSPDTLIYSKGVVQLARYYNIPCRTGGSLSDAHLADGQAMFEGTLTLQNALSNDVDYILHAFGMLSSYLATSLEKWVMDEELCRIILSSRKKLTVNEETLGIEDILTMGCKGEYLTHPSTFKQFRNLYEPHLGNRDSHNIWTNKGSKDAMDQAEDLLSKRLESYEKPSIDSGLEQELTDWVAKRKATLMPN